MDFRRATPEDAESILRFWNWSERGERRYLGLPVNSVRESTKQRGLPNGSLA